MRTRIIEQVRGHEVVTSIGIAALLGLLLMLAPVLDRAALLVASTAVLISVGALAIWLLRDHKVSEWTTSAGRVPRVRGSDRRVTALARSINAAVTGDEAAQSRVQSTLRSLADARLAPQGLALDDRTAEAEATLGKELTAYLIASKPRQVTTDELASFITTLEEN